MARYFIELSFLGSGYHGWQSQPNANTVQRVLENAMQILAGKALKTTGAGRTDAGVHALFFTAHFDSDHSLFEENEQCVRKLNALLPEDIAISAIYRVKDSAHARYSALSRTYEYHIHTFKDPFATHISWFYHRPLNLQAMNEAALKIIEHTDFTSFSKLHSDVQTNNCKIFEAQWIKNNGKITFRVTADRFLRNMVRAMVGTMIDIGTGKLDSGAITRILEQRDRRHAGYSVPAHGLHLVMISYPDGLKARSEQKSLIKP